ncbi:MAG: Peptidase [Gemmatimonadetes bacterium]|nr:Peptidase [Gemmatimonadota bacterium]
MTSAIAAFPLRLVDGCGLEPRYRDVLRPGATLVDHRGYARRLPRWFYEVHSWEQARDTYLAPHFAVSEFIHTDVRETPALRVFPRYVPCAITLLALALERLREEVGTYVYVGANGGYCSPLHSRIGGASPHCWGTAANIYRVGDTYLDNQDDIARYAIIAQQTLPTVWTRPLGPELAKTDDHLHLDLGYVISEPREAVGISNDVRLAGDPL